MSKLGKFVASRAVLEELLIAATSGALELGLRHAMQTGVALVRVEDREPIIELRLLDSGRAGRPPPPEAITAKLGRVRVTRDVLDELFQATTNGAMKNGLTHAIRTGAAVVQTVARENLVEFRISTTGVTDVEAAEFGPDPDLAPLTTVAKAVARSALDRALSMPSLAKAPLPLSGDLPRVAIVLGTFNRMGLLARAVESLRAAGREIGGAHMVVVDGGSTDGSREWLCRQPDVVLIGQRGPLTGAVRAFNLGFGYAVDAGYEIVVHFNDDAELITPGALARVIEIFEAEPRAAAVAFGFDLRGKFEVDQVHGKPYSNFGAIRREAGMTVARAQGDPTGRNWWNPIYRTYGADCELGCWLWKLGFEVVALPEAHVRDYNCKDELRRGNEAFKKDAQLFWKRWPSPRDIRP